MILKTIIFISIFLITRRIVIEILSKKLLKIMNKKTYTRF